MAAWVSARWLARLLSSYLVSNDGCSPKVQGVGRGVVVEQGQGCSQLLVNSAHGSDLGARRKHQHVQQQA